MHMAAGPRPPQPHRCRRRLVLAPVGFRQGKGKAPVMAPGLGTTLGPSRRGGSVALGVQRARGFNPAQLGSQGVKWSVKHGPPPPTPPFLHQNTPPGWHKPLSPPQSRGHGGLGCCGCLELPQREVLEWGGTDKDVGPPPPLSRSQPTAPQPMLVGGEGLGGAPPTLGCPLQEGCSGGPRGGALGRAPHYLLAWGERGFWGDGAPALAGVQPAPTSGTGCCAQVRHPPRQGGVAALPC